jgi:hypothetical protein
VRERACGLAEDCFEVVSADRSVEVVRVVETNANPGKLYERPSGSASRPNRLGQPLAHGFDNFRL